MLSEVSSLDDLFSWERLLQLLAIACVALVPSALIRRFSQRRLKLDVQSSNGLVAEKKVQWHCSGKEFVFSFDALHIVTLLAKFVKRLPFIFKRAALRWRAFIKLTGAVFVWKSVLCWQMFVFLCHSLAQHAQYLYVDVWTYSNDMERVDGVVEALFFRFLVIQQHYCFSLQLLFKVPVMLSDFYLQQGHLEQF